MERTKIGEVFHFYGKISVAAIRLTDGSLAVGDTVVIQGPTTDLEQRVEGLQIEHENVASAQRGQEVGLKVRDRVRERDFVFKLVETPMPPPPKAAPAARPKAAAKRARKPRAKPKSKRTGKRVKRASRAARKTKRRGSRKSRSR